MTLSKRIPARTVTLNARWCRKDFTTFDESYRRIRGHSRYKGFECYWCHHKFEDGESIALACIEGTGNKVFCSDCADGLT